MLLHLDLQHQTARETDDFRATSGPPLIATEERTSWDVSNVPSPEVSLIYRSLRRRVLPRQGIRPYEQKASAVLVIV